MKKKLICALMTAAMAGSLVSGLTVSADSDSQVTISLYTTLPNKDSQFEQLCEEFMEENPDIKVNYIAYDSSEKQKWMTLYASGEAPTSRRGLVLNRRRGCRRRQKELQLTR